MNACKPHEGKTTSSPANEDTGRRRPEQGDLTGTWIQEIPEMDGELRKTDIVRCTHLGNSFKGQIRRLIPESQRFKQWTFEGRVTGGHILGSVRALGISKTRCHCETFHLHLIETGHLEGWFLKARLSEDPGGDGATDKLRIIPVQWGKVQDGQGG